MATAEQDAWLRATEQLAASARRARRLVVGAQVGVAVAFAVLGVAAVPAPAGWQLLLLAAAASWSAVVTAALARGLRPVEHCCMAQLPTALVAALAGVTGPRGSASAAVAVLVLLVLAAAPYAEPVHLVVLTAAAGAGALAVLAAVDPGRFPTAWLGALTVLGVGVGLARQSRDQHLVLRDLVEREVTDAVTGLPTGGLLHQTVQRAFAAADARRPLALLAVGIDGYRDLDHAHGFRVTDEVLGGVAARLREALPPDATFGRGEGDTLVAVLTGTDLALAHDVAARLDAAARHRFPRPDGTPDDLPAVRIGVGIAVHPAPDVLDRPATSGRALLARAEAALHAGRLGGIGSATAPATGPQGSVARPAYV